MKISKLSFFVVSLCLLQQYNLFSQSGIYGTDRPVQKNLNSVPAELSNTLPQNVSVYEQEQISSDALEIQKQMMTAKQTGNVSEAIRLQYLLDKATGNSETRPAELLETEITNKLNPNEFIQDNFHNDVLIDISDANSPHRNIATVTEQRGANIGRIWMVSMQSVYSDPYTIKLQMKLFFSDDNGMSWGYFGQALTPSPHIFLFYPSHMDIELIENNSGDKYIWMVYNGTTANSNNQVRVCGAVINISSFNVQFFDMAWPVTLTAVSRPRIVSDNSVYAYNPYVYIVAEGKKPGTTIYCSAVAECLNPFTMNPVFVYRNTPFCYGFNKGYDEALNLASDIAFFSDNGTPSVMITEKFKWDGTSTDRLIFVSKASLWNFVSGTAYGLPSINTIWKINNYPHIASSGNNNKLMIACVRSFNNSSDLDPISYYTTNGGSSWTFYYIDPTTNYNTLFDEVSINSPRENAANYNVAWFQYALQPAQEQIQSGIYTGSWSVSTILSQNSFCGNVSDYRDAQPGYIFLPESPGMNSIYNSMTAWFAESLCYEYSLWASFETPGQRRPYVNGTPDKFGLEQNYPNPFNPSTKIRFTLPKDVNVKLIVFDILGREVITLVNGVIDAGIHEINFDASLLSSGVYFYRIQAGKYTTKKKMLLIK